MAKLLLELPPKLSSKERERFVSVNGKVTKIDDDDDVEKNKVLLVVLPVVVWS